MLLPNKITKTCNGNTVEYYRSNSASDVLVIGVFHGDEPQGDYIIRKYLSLNIQSNLSFIPCLNPDGMQVGKRTNSNGVDLNRNFPTKNWLLSPVKDDYYGGEQPASENETRFLIDIIKDLSPKLIVTLHSPYKIVNYDGEALDIACKISEIMNYPIQSDIGYPTPGSFGTWAGLENNIPTITLELDEQAPVESYEQNVFKVFEMLEHFYEKEEYGRF